MLERIAPKLYIINIDSDFDWTGEVRKILDEVDWFHIRKLVAPDVPNMEWISRPAKLGTIALVSRLQFEQIYDNWRDEWDDNVNGHLIMTLYGH